jgi:nucleoside-diphosphate-sugar epimerase
MVTPGMIGPDRCSPARGGEKAPDGAPRVLVTGGTGFLGRALVTRLAGTGYSVRVFARRQPAGDLFHGLPVEILPGDVSDLASFDAAMRGCRVVIHLAAGTSGLKRDCDAATIQGTRNLLELCRRHEPERVIYVSSCNVYGVARCATHAVVDEQTPLEPHPERRGNYSASKQEAEREVVTFSRSSKVSTVVLRTGTIYGPGGDLYPQLMGVAAGSLHLVIGMGGHVLPFVYVDNLVDAIAACIERPEAVGEIFNVVDPEPLTKRAYVNRVVRRARPHAHVLFLPYPLVYMLVWMQELAAALLKREPFLTCYRLTSSQKRIVYSSRKIASQLGWTPGVAREEALDRVAAAECGSRPASRQPVHDVVDTVVG